MIPLIFIFLSCREKAYDNKEFSRENSKPRRESPIKSSSEFGILFLAFLIN